MGVCYIVASMKTQYKIDKKPGDCVIAADGGYGQDCGCAPDFVVGDFDSLGYVPKGDGVQVHPKQKDDTDMMLAVKLGLSKGYDEFVLLGGIGGRLDHTLANVQTLAYLYSQGAKAVLRSEKTDVYFVGAKEKEAGILTFDEKTKGILSVFSYGQSAQQVQIKGAEYEMENGAFEDSFPLGVSNSFVGNKVCISVGEGRLLVVHEKE